MSVKLIPKPIQDQVRQLEKEFISICASSESYDKIEALSLKLKEGGYKGTELITSDGDVHTIYCYVEI